VREAARRLGPTTPAEEAVVLVRPGAAAVLRRTATALEPDVAGPDEQTPWDRLRLSGAQADELLAFGADLYVESPAALRDEVVSRLRTAVGAAS
jgi:proteasome accessory factor B